LSLETPTLTKPTTSEARWWVAPALILIVLVAIVIDAMTYKQTEPTPPTGFAGLPTWTLVAIILGVGVVGLAAVEWVRPRRVWSGIPFIVAMVAVTVVAIFLTAISLEGITVPASIKEAPGTSATRQAQLTLASATSTGNCIIVQHDAEIPLQSPYQRCAYLGVPRQPSQVTYITDWNSQSWYGFIYSPGATQPAGPDTCVRHIAGAWWAYMALGDPARACPFTFQFIEAP